MPIETKWYLDQRIVYTRAYGVIRAEDILNEDEVIKAMIRKGVPPVHFIINSSGVEKVLVPLRVIAQSANLFKEPQLGWALHVSTNTLFNFLGSAAAQMSTARFKAVKSDSDALEVLKKVDLSLSAALPVSW